MKSPLTSIDGFTLHTVLVVRTFSIRLRDCYVVILMARLSASSEYFFSISRSSDDYYYLPKADRGCKAYFSKFVYYLTESTRKVKRGAKAHPSAKCVL